MLSKEGQLLMSKSVLIVDDHAVVRRMVSSKFLKQGFRVCNAENGAEAVDKAQVEKPDLIILDLVMPVMNGFEAARALKVLMPHVPLVMFTNVVGPTMEKDARDAGFSALVPKLESVDRLLSHADELLH
jgi:CheY-like chemotaxis protein